MNPQSQSVNTTKVRKQHSKTNPKQSAGANQQLKLLESQVEPQKDSAITRMPPLSKIKETDNEEFFEDSPIIPKDLIASFDSEAPSETAELHKNCVIADKGIKKARKQKRKNGISSNYTSSSKLFDSNLAIRYLSRKCFQAQNSIQNGSSHQHCRIVTI